MTPRPPEPVEPIVKLLCILLVFFSVMVLACEHFFPNDGQVFQVFTGVLSSISGALFMRVKPASPTKAGDDNSTNIGKVVTEEQPPAKI